MVRTLETTVAAFRQDFDYSLLAPKTAEAVRKSAKRIREKVKKTLVDIIEVGQDLLKSKDALPHGQFGRWLLAEFGWTDRTARNFMAVAEHFGPKSEMISDLRIAPTAAYLLAAPSASFGARQAALDRAATGERITAPIAQEILSAMRKTVSLNGKGNYSDRLWQRLTKLLCRFQERTNSTQLSALARHLREFADELENGKRIDSKSARNGIGK